MFKTAWKCHPGISRIDKKPKAHRIIIFRGSSSWSVIIRQLFRGVCLLSLLLSKLYNDFPVEERTHRETYFNTNAHWNSIWRNQCYSKHVMETHQMSTLLIYIIWLSFHYIILYDFASQRTPSTRKLYCHLQSYDSGRYASALILKLEVIYSMFLRDCKTVKPLFFIWWRIKQTPHIKTGTINTHFHTSQWFYWQLSTKSKTKIIKKHLG